MADDYKFFMDLISSVVLKEGGEIFIDMKDLPPCGQLYYKHVDGGVKIRFEIDKSQVH